MVDSRLTSKGAFLGVAVALACATYSGVLDVRTGLVPILLAFVAHEFVGFVTYTPVTLGGFWVQGQAEVRHISKKAVTCGDEHSMCSCFCRAFENSLLVAILTHAIISRPQAAGGWAATPFSLLACCPFMVAPVLLTLAVLAFTIPAAVAERRFTNTLFLVELFHVFGGNMVVALVFHLHKTYLL